VDIVDAPVVLSARAQRAVIVTTDPADLRRARLPPVSADTASERVTTITGDGPSTTKNVQGRP
jgi:hypothetical protein